MATGKGPDPKRRKTSHVHSTYLSVKNGQKVGAYKAGEMFGCYGHRTHAHQPCLFDLTDGKIPCPDCGAGRIPEWRGYVPLWDVDWTLRHVLIGEDYFETVDRIEHGAQVIVWRDRPVRSPLVVREEECFSRKLPDKTPWNLPVNMLVVCLTLWKCPELLQWYRINRPHELMSQQFDTPKTKAAKVSADPLQRLAEAERKAKEEDEARQALIGQAINRMIDPKPNGKPAFKRPT